jgi:hypothetical protein
MTTRAQGSSVHVTDPVALRRIAEILWPEEPSSSPRRARRRDRSRDVRLVASGLRFCCGLL